MLLPNYLIISFIGTILLFAFMLCYLYYLYNRQREFDSKEDSAYNKSSEIIQEAQVHANEIVEKAVDRAKSTLVETDYLRDDLMKNLESNLNQLAQQTITVFKNNSQGVDQKYQELFSKTKQEYEAKLNYTLKSLEAIAGRELEDFSKNLKKETLNSQVFIGARINEEFEKKQKEIEDYKLQRLKAIDENINKIIARVSQEVLGKAIPLDEHERLVIEALERAKKEEVFI